jgi:DNA-binding MarR family transcriptional regulator
MDRISLDGYVIDTLMPDLVGHDRQPAAFLVYLFLWRQTAATGIAEPADSSAAGEVTVQRSLREIAECTGLSKRAVQSAVKRLADRKLIAVSRESITAVSEYRVLMPWRR